MTLTGNANNTTSPNSAAAPILSPRAVSDGWRQFVCGGVGASPDDNLCPDAAQPPPSAFAIAAAPMIPDRDRGDGS